MNKRTDSRPGSGRKPPARASLQPASHESGGRVAKIITAAVLVAIVAVVAAAAHSAGHTPKSTHTAVASVAPDGSFITTAGRPETVSSLRGHPTLLWFVSKSCGSCQAGTQAVASQIGSLAARRVRVVELDVALDGGDLAGMRAFAHQVAGAASANPDWTFGVASAALTRTYDGPGYLDIYFLLDSAGRIRYTGSEPASTMSALLAAAARAGSQA